MNLKQKITQDLKEALKAKEEVRLSVLRMLQAAIKNKEVEKRTKLSKPRTIRQLADMRGKSEEEKDLVKASQLTDEEVVEVISSEIKKRKEAVEQYESGGRPELARKEKTEMETLQQYMPEQLSEDEIRKLAQEAIAKVGASGPQDMGKVMGVLMADVKGKADGAIVSKIVKEELAS